MRRRGGEDACLPRGAPRGERDTAEEIPGWPSESLPSMPKGNSFCSPLGRWEVKARAAQGSSHSPGIEMKAGLLESELENSSSSA